MGGISFNANAYHRAALGGSSRNAHLHAKEIRCGDPIVFFLISSLLRTHATHWFDRNDVCGFTVVHGCRVGDIYRKTLNSPSQELRTKVCQLAPLTRFLTQSLSVSSPKTMPECRSGPEVLHRNLWSPPVAPLSGAPGISFLPRPFSGPVLHEFTNAAVAHFFRVFHLVYPC